ncbi:GNAT family N-acetyltransferase [Yoonia sp.]|uniref:GNAT family N-acetyltransferase n=1 Tax=Yoonia sp. TaxID=2212373 RepID=UPI0035C7C862
MPEFDAHFEVSRSRQSQNEKPDFRAHLDRAFGLMEQLFPHGLRGSYLVFDPAVSHTARHQGIGRRLIDVAIAKAKVAGCQNICLDMAADNRAVAFYKRICIWFCRYPETRSALCNRCKKPATLP